MKTFNTKPEVNPYIAQTNYKCYTFVITVLFFASVFVNAYYSVRVEKLEEQLALKTFAVTKVEFESITPVKEVEEVILVEEEVEVVPEVVQSEPVVKVSTAKIELTQEQKIIQYTKEVGDIYGIDPALIQSIIYHESRFDPKASSGPCHGLMQVCPKWHTDRAARLGVTNFFDAYSGVLIGTDYFAEILRNNKHTALALMVYNQGYNSAFTMYSNGDISWYANAVMNRAEMIRRGEV